MISVMEMQSLPVKLAMYLQSFRMKLAVQDTRTRLGGALTAVQQLPKRNTVLLTMFIARMMSVGAGS
jgi:hypothetical protein